MYIDKHTEQWNKIEGSIETYVLAVLQVDKDIPLKNIWTYTWVSHSLCNAVQTSVDSIQLTGSPAVQIPYKLAQTQRLREDLRSPRLLLENQFSQKMYPRPNHHGSKEQQAE